MKHLHALILACFVLLAVAAPLAAQGGEPSDDEVNQIAKELYCPVCENVPLDVCPTQACVQWRATIRELLVEGYTEEEVKQYFANQYGDRVLAEPPASGLNLLFWILPPVIIIGGAVFLWRFFRSSQAEPLEAEATPVETTSNDEYVARLEELLAKRR